MSDRVNGKKKSICALHHNALLASALAFACTVATASTGVGLDHATRQLEIAVERDLVRGAVVGVYDSGSVSYEGVGKTTRGSSTPPTKDTLFEIGSITKVFTALLVQTLVDGEELNWDSTLQESLPMFDFANEEVKEITLRELAIHASGLPRMPTNMQPGDLLDPYADYSVEQLVTFLEDFDPEALDKSQVYSNLGFGLLGTIAAFGVDYSDLMSSNVFDPLEMTNSHTSHSPKTRQNLATGFSRGATMPNWNFVAMAGAGCILSSAEDLMKFAIRNLESLETPIDESLRNLREAQIASNQGLGWALLQTDDGKPVYWHGGATGGYVSFLAISPEESKGWVILATSTESALITDLGMSFFRSPQETDAVDLSPYVGVFELAPELYITFFERDSQLFGQASGQPEFPLTHSEDRNFGFELGGISIIFGEPDNGQAQDLEWTQGGQTIPAKRVDDSLGITHREAIELSEATLSQYPGKYELAENVFLTIIHRDGQLFAHATGQPVFPVFATEKDRFFYKVVDAEIHFERNESNSVTALVLHQNGEMRAPKVSD